jgi:predicted  nucleic acid-binding Zn-ribbon protein
MNPTIPQMLELQRLDQATAALRAELEGMPRRLREADAKLNSDRATLAAAKEVLTRSLGERKKLELDVEQWKGRAKKYREQSSSVKTNEAYKALQHEIVGAEAEASKAEDRVLEQMMAVEEVERRVKRLEAELKDSEKAMASEKQQIEAQFAEKKKNWETATAERKATAKKIPADTLDLYERIARKNPGHALAQVRDGQCRACGLRVLPHIVQLLESDTNEELFRCESCGRILYSLEPIRQAAPPKESATGAANN